MLIPNSSEIRKPSKTLAGVTPIAVMAKPRKCKHGVCLYCPSLDVPQSYTPLSPPVIRAKMLNYNPYLQVKSRLKAFKIMNHPTDKIELIIMGGTFLSYPLSYQYEFVKSCYDALNEKKSSSLEQAKKRNEKAEHRCVALCVETRPDVCGKKEIARLLEFGCTRVELGVQAIDDNVYKKINRGHTVKDVIEATKLLKNANFKVFYHIMLGLPGSNPEKDLKMFKEIFISENFKPDGLKIYPCQVIKGSKLEELYKQGKYKPYTKEKIQELIIKIMMFIPNYCRVMRIMREIPPIFLIAGTERIDLRKDIEAELKKKNININEIRFREIGFRWRDKLPKEKINQNLKLKITRYEASGGIEYFLEFINKDNILFGLCRLRIKKENAFVHGAIRELHVYGQSLSVGERANSEEISQHRGLGKRLVKKAEGIAKNNGVRELYVIAGIGVKKYFYKMGYKKKGYYVSKKLE